MAKTGTVARLFGLSDEGLRMYERYGVLQPEKNPETGYRNYNVMDIVTLMSSRMYRQCGFSLAETSHFVNESNISDIHTAFLEKADEMEELIAFQRRKLSRIKQVCRLMEQAEQQLGRCSRRVRPAMYRLEFLVKNKVVDVPSVEPLIQKWAELAPFSALSSRYMIEPISGTDPDAVSGLGVLEDDANFLGITENKWVTYWPKADCIYSIIRSDQTHLKADMSHMLSYLKHHHLELNGDVITRAIISTHQNQEFNRYLQIWLPVKKLSKRA